MTNSLYTGRQIAALTIACDPRDSLSLEKRSQVTVTWYRFGAVTSTNNKYRVNDGNFSLDISNPGKISYHLYTGFFLTCIKGFLKNKQWVKTD